MIVAGAHQTEEKQKRHENGKKPERKIKKKLIVAGQSCGNADERKNTERREKVLKQPERWLRNGGSKIGADENEQKEEQKNVSFRERHGVEMKWSRDQRNEFGLVWRE